MTHKSIFQIAFINAVIDTMLMSITQCFCINLPLQNSNLTTGNHTPYLHIPLFKGQPSVCYVLCMQPTICMFNMCNPWKTMKIMSIIIYGVTFKLEMEILFSLIQFHYNWHLVAILVISLGNESTKYAKYSLNRANLFKCVHLNNYIFCH